jgi:hypothetical protein
MKNVNCCSRSPRRRMRWYSVISATSAYIRLVLTHPALPPYPLSPSPLSPSSLPLPPPLSHSLPPRQYHPCLHLFCEYYLPILNSQSYCLFFFAVPFPTWTCFLYLLFSVFLPFSILPSTPPCLLSLIGSFLSTFCSFPFSQCILSGFSC